MQYKDLRDFIAQLERLGELRRIAVAVDPHLEMTEICDRVLRAGGPAILFETPTRPCHAGAGQPVRHAAPGGVGHGRRTMWAHCARSASLLAFLKEPEPPKGMRDAVGKTADFQKGIWTWPPKKIGRPPCQERDRSSVRWIWSRCPSKPAGRRMPGPLITWGWW
jgi:4-hydroxy-3-polyprenylbenzoate decarboxylase